MRSNGVITTLIATPPAILPKNDVKRGLFVKYSYEYKNCLAYSKELNWETDPKKALGIDAPAPRKSPFT